MLPAWSDLTLLWRGSSRPTDALSPWARRTAASSRCFGKELGPHLVSRSSVRQVDRFSVVFRDPLQPRCSVRMLWPWAGKIPRIFGLWLRRGARIGGLGRHRSWGAGKIERDAGCQKRKKYSSSRRGQRLSTRTRTVAKKFIMLGQVERGELPQRPGNDWAVHWGRERRGGGPWDGR